MARPKSAVSRGSQIVSCCIPFRQYCTPFKAAHHLRWTALWRIFWQLQRRYELDIGENLGEKTRVFFLLLVGLKEDHFWLARCRKTRQTNYIYIYIHMYIYIYVPVKSLEICVFLFWCLVVFLRRFSIPISLPVASRSWLATRDSAFMQLVRRPSTCGSDLEIFTIPQKKG